MIKSAKMQDDVIAICNNFENIFNKKNTSRARVSRVKPNIVLRNTRIENSQRLLSPANQHNKVSSTSHALLIRLRRLLSAKVFESIECPREDSFSDRWSSDRNRISFDPQH